MMKPIFYLVLIFAYFSWHVLGDDHNEKDSGEEENGGAFYCFLVRNTCDKIDLYSELDPYKNLSCTHMVYGFAVVNSTNWTVSPSWWDTLEVEEWEGNNTAVTSLHESSNMTILLGIYNDGNLSFIDSPESRENFAKEVVKSARQHGFQGIFFYFKSSQHFEDPQFLDFLVSLKKELDIDAEDSNRLQVVISIEPKHFERSHEVFPNIVPYFDGFYLLSDDTPSSERNDIAFQVNPLFPSTLNQTIVPEETISVIAEDLVDNLIPRDKLIIGLSVWANSFVLEDPNLAGHGEKVITKVKDSVTGRNDGKLAYFEICGLKNSSDIVYDSTAETTSFSAEGLWFSLNVPGHESFEKKLKWIEENKFGGVGLTSLKADDKDGVCGEGPFPVHRYVGEQLQRSQSISESEDNNNKAPACTRICIIRPEDTPSGFSFSNIETRWCSHIVLSSAKILSLPGSVFLPFKITKMVEEYKKWQIKEKPKLIISIGAQEIPDNWRVYLQTVYRRQFLIDSIKNILVDTGADGVDISWTRGHLDNPKDMEVYTIFLEELKKQIGQKYLIFVEITPQSTFNERYDFFRMNKSVDFIIAQGHRFHSHNKAFTGHHSPLFMTEDLSDIRMTIEGFTSELVKRGVPKEKLIIGLSAEAMGMRLMVGDRMEVSAIEIGAASSTFDFVRRSTHPGVVTQSDVCHSLQKNSTVSKFNPKIGVPYLIDGPEFIAYDDVRSIQLKTIWSSMNHFGGIALFAIEMDNIAGECPVGKPYSLLKTIVDAQTCDTCSRSADQTASDLNTTTDVCAEAPFHVVCGYNLAMKNGTDSMEPYEIPYQKCTEIVVEEAMLDADGELRYERAAQDPLRDLVKFHAQRKGTNSTKLVSAIRCKMTVEEFSKVINDRERFFEKISSHMKLFGFSGIEFRCNDVITQETSMDFSSMLEHLQIHLKRTKNPKECLKTVGIRIPAQTNNLKSSYDIPALNKLHSVVIDSFSSPSNYSELLNPLFGMGLGGDSETLDSIIKNWINEGVSPRKIVFSIPAYGIWQKFKNSFDHGLGQPVEDSIDLLTREQLCKKFKQLGIADRRFVYEAVGAYATTIDDEFLSYETPETVGYKVKYAIRENLGGVAIDSLNHEDFNNSCKTGPFPLLEAIYSNKCVV